MNIPPEPVFIPEEACDGIDFIHCVIRIIDHGRAQKKPEDLFPQKILHECAGHLFRPERATLHIGI
jgi:hypothetical protein